MSQLIVCAGEFASQARFEEQLASKTVRWKAAQKIRFEEI
jgi:hypothetical protein